MTEIVSHTDKLAFHLEIQQGAGEGHGQFTDDDPQRFRADFAARSVLKAWPAEGRPAAPTPLHPRAARVPG